MRIRALDGALQKARVGEIRLEERLANYTYMGVGGPCRALVRPPDLASLERLIRLLGELEVAYVAIGGGTNLLVSDEGFDGVVVSTDALQEWTETSSNSLRTGSGVTTSRIVRWAAGRNLSGLEGLAGVPGTIGGASVMNAGGTWGDISDSLMRVEVVTGPPEVHTVTVEAEALNLAYRSSSLPAGSVIGRVEEVKPAGWVKQPKAPLSSATHNNKEIFFIELQLLSTIDNRCSCLLLIVIFNNQFGRPKSTPNSTQNSIERRRRMRHNPFP